MMSATNQRGEEPARRRLPLAICCLAIFASAAGCHRDMQDQPRYEMYEQSDFFADGMSARPVIAGTVARGELEEDEAFHTGKSEGKFVTELPVEVDRALLERGRERFNIYCSVCHAVTGLGDGMIVQRGFRRPPSLHIERLRNAAAGHFYDVVTHGFGAMPSYAVQIPPRDRWAIVAYVRVLQLSQHATVDDVPAEELEKLEEAGQ
jgi:mono/diheme cytochrome c family protein